jgi:trigger factor
VKDSKGDVVDLTDFVSVASEEGPAGEDEAIEPTAVTDPGEVRI